MSISALTRDGHRGYVSSPVRGRNRRAPTLFMLYGRIVVPMAVSSEMRHPGAPLLLRRWVEDYQEKIQVRSVQIPDDPRLAFLDLGEREAIVLDHFQGFCRPAVDRGVGSAIHGCRRFSSGALRSSFKRLLKAGGGLKSPTPLPASEILKMV